MEKTDQVLIALYAEALHGGSFCEVTRASMGMESAEFGWTLYLMQMSGLIDGCSFIPPQPGSRDNIMGVNRKALCLTPKGFERAQALTGDQESTDGKLCALWDMLRSVGCGVMANIVYKWLS